MRGEDPRGPALAAWSAMHGLAALLVDGLLARQGLGPSPGRSVESLTREVTDALFEGLLRKDEPGRPAASR